MKGETINVIPETVPADYHCRCAYCVQAIGELRHPDGSYYSRRLGHGSAAITLGVYGHLFKPDERAAVAIERALTK